MDDALLKTQLQSTLKQSIALALPSYTIYSVLKTYRATFGLDSFFYSTALGLSQSGPLVSLICLNCPDSNIDEFLSRQLYANLEIVRVTSEDSFTDVIDYIMSSKSKYFCFYEPNHYYDSCKIFDMVYSLEQLPSIDILLTLRKFVDLTDTIIDFSEALYSGDETITTINGTLLLQYCINENQNLFGNLSTLMVTAQHAQKISFDMPDVQFNTINSLSFLFQFLINAKIHMLNQPLVATLLQPYMNDEPLQKAYKEFVTAFSAKHSFVISPEWKKEYDRILHPLPEITFFYTDMGEYYNLAPIATEASRRGYKISFTQNKKQKAEIGIYCQHECYPENSKFSVILLHDMAQGHNRWPNIWRSEPWNKFDIGIVPGKMWASLWSQCACQYYANPKYGVYELGYPKSDLVNSPALEERTQKLLSEFQFKYNFTILYAPSWENDGKEDDFIRALSSLKVNLLIKQADWSPDYSHITKNILQMRSMHEGCYDNVYYMDSSESILTALKICDMVVSDESSVMIEALMFDKPSIAVIDWLIPDTTPSRHAIFPLDCVIKCKKIELRTYAEKLFSDSSFYCSILEKRKYFFSNQGFVCRDIMDAIEYYTAKKPNRSFLSKKLTSKYASCSLWN